MKVKYLGIFAALMLSLGLVTSCATPDAGDVDAGGDPTEVEPDAGVGEVEPEPAE